MNAMSASVPHLPTLFGQSEHGVEDTQRSNRYRATRARVGMEWLFTPLMLSQNNHLVHHQYPSVSFCRYLRTWISSAGDDGGVAGRLEAEITPIAAQDLGARWSPVRYGTRWLPAVTRHRRQRRRNLNSQFRIWLGFTFDYHRQISLDGISKSVVPQV
jgi:hypothetical protein